VIGVFDLGNEYGIPGINGWACDRCYRQECMINRAMVERLDPHRQYASSVIIGRRTLPTAVQSET
jgi:hypothetical protein